jgi:quercetin dioxygenase-like cupin family protein
MRTPLAALGLLLLPIAGLSAQATPPAKAPTLTWGPAPAVFPKGATMAVVSGDPGKAAMFTIELSMPSGYRIAPHFHPTDEAVEVKKGTLMVGMGDTFDTTKTKPMKVGDKATIAAMMHHYASAQGATLISVTAMGPFALTYVNPADDPQKAPAKP